MHPLLVPTAEFVPDSHFRIALIYDDRPRSDTTGRYCFKYLSKMCATTHILPDRLAFTAKEDYDLFLHIDDGLDYLIPNTLYPRAWWVIDTHLNLARDIERAYGYDWVFVAQKPGADALKEAGILNVWWLPLAADPTLAVPSAKEFDWSFVGHWQGPTSGDRTETINKVKNIGKNFIGQATPEHMYEIYGSSKAVLNPPIRDDINMRVFEAMAAGAILVTKNVKASGMEELFEEGRDYIGYQTTDDAAQALLRVSAMSNQELSQITARAKDKAFSRDTYGHRMKALLEITTSVPGIQAQYFRHVRQELLAIIPPQSHSILDIGCATGKLGEAIKSRQLCHVTGVEMHPRAAREAAKLLDRVYVGRAEEILEELNDNSFDCIILADVLEHMLNPWEFLRRLHQKLEVSPDSRIIISLPNVAHWSVILPLLQGEWRYEDSGILDATHLRFFTPQSALRMIQAASLEVESAQGVVLPRPAEISSANNVLTRNWLDGGLSEVYQILFICRIKQTQTGIGRKSSLTLPEELSASGSR
ncbi:MAG: methyltransferase domain-containing protein [Firmicutes bacterium]|jgi:2-polyprenyl-3-methyl-5-hydroxy-6-metoxy-1,4-benzoquinol methylase|nr:methyltransferase domain-containing protein [Bacillota bacterium]